MIKPSNGNGKEDTTSSRKRLGEVMQEQGYVTPEQVADALKVQGRPGESRMLGQILISRGYATAPQVQVALARQKLPPRK